jgi:DNA-binding NtrC family response regulator
MASQAGFRVLVVDDEKELRESVSDILRSLGHHEVHEAADGQEAVEKVLAGNYQLVILDVNMPRKSGIEVLKEIREHDPSIIVLIITAHGKLADAVEAIKIGAFNYIEKPVQEKDILALVDKAREAHRMVEEIGFSSPTLLLDEGEEFIGRSNQMKSVFQLIHRLTNVSTSVLIRGENGTGKELVAKAIHFNSIRKDKKFVAVNCGAIPENLIESEFFGHEKGAFTGADQRHIGKFQYAEGGTLFLDEIGDISAPMQVKLLRVLQERKFMPVGSNREIKTDVRIIAATNRNLEKMVADGTFRQDLFYRLNVMPIYLPPLRERVDDIPPLVEKFIEKFNKLHGTNKRAIKEDALNALRNYAWPGNIRELENAIERAFVIETSPSVTFESLPETIKTKQELPTGIFSSTLDFQHQKEEFEKQFILSALKMFAGRINQTVAHAGIPKNTLLRKMRKYGINPKEFGSTDAELQEQE